MIRRQLRTGWLALSRPSAPPLRLTWRNWVFDTLLMLGLSLVAIASANGSQRPASFYPSSVWVPTPPVAPPEPIASADQFGWSAFMFLLAVPLIFRRRYPLSMLWVTLAIAPFTVHDHATLRLSFYVCVIVGYSAAVYSPYRIPALAGLPIAALIYMQLQGNLNDPTQGAAVPTVPRDSVPFLILVPIAVAAHGLRRWRSQADAERERAATLERDQAEALRHAAEKERARIARELHDVVTHNVSVMVIQAGAARKVLDTEPEQARDALLSVEASGRSAMTELRHVMGLLTMGETDVELAPQPGLAQLEALVERVRAAGVSVNMAVTGQPRPLPDGVELAAYRVVQEALTNAVKHATGATATVLVEHSADQLRIEVTDTGGRTSGSTGNGRGLIGLRERLAVYGGTVQTGPRIRGGYRVEAVLPIPADEP